MTTVTTPDAIVAITNTDPASIVTESSLQASSIQLAFDKRQNYDFRWADSTARGNQAGMVYGSQGFQVDTGEGYFYNGSTWRLWDKPLTSFTPTISGTTVGSTGTNTATWSVASGRAFVEGSILLGGTGISVGNTTVTTPVTMIAYSANTPLGLNALADAGVNTYTGTCVYASTTTVRFITINVGATYPTTTLLSSTVPFTWATGDYISYSYTFTPA